jgi:NAD(P)-dependent dehydrogenase (short-subunit alcohol dehydrogenase family)
VIIVTGAASGLGKADAERLAEEGARLVLTDINEADGRQVADACDALFVAQDVSDEAGWAALIDLTVANFGRLDGLVNNAGTFTSTAHSSAAGRPCRSWPGVVVVRLSTCPRPRRWSAYRPIWLTQRQKVASEQ